MFPLINSRRNYSIYIVLLFLYFLLHFTLFFVFIYIKIFSNFYFFVGLDSKGKKDELIKLIQESSSLRDLKDSGFRVPIYIECKPSDRPSCYPEIYEGIENSTALRNKAMNSLKAPTP